MKFIEVFYVFLDGINLFDNFFLYLEFVSKSGELEL